MKLAPSPHGRRHLRNGSLMSSCLLAILISSPCCFAWSPNQRHNPLIEGRHTSQFQGPHVALNSRLSCSSQLSMSATTDATTSISSINNMERLETLANLANDALDAHGSDILKTFNARVGVISPTDNNNDPTEKSDFQNNFLRLGLLATENFKDDQQVASLPFYDTDGSGLAFAPHIATKVVFKDMLPDGYDGWTGDIGLLAMLLLNEMARLNVSDGGGKGISSPSRKDGIQSLMSAWVASLPSSEEMAIMHPLLWNEEDQEKLQSSSTKKIYRLLDDIDDDSSWLDEKLWSLDRSTFPESVSIQVGDDVEERPCFSPAGFRYAIALVRSRSFFVDGSERLLPYLDFANHDDYDSYELRDGGVGTLWGSVKGALLKSGKKMQKGDEVRISYGPKGPADYLLDHGFVPDMCQAKGGGSAVTAELSFEVDDSDRFRDDKLDVLEYETYDLAPMEPLQTFDVTGGPGSTGEPDPAMIQFLRLARLGGKDAFLLESIFRKEIWGFMSEPVSEDNERRAVTDVIKACETALSEIGQDDLQQEEGTSTDMEKLCSMLRESEREALSRTLVYAKQEAEALDLKEYYQVRRLKGLGLDSDWTPEDDTSFGGPRVPGGADYDW